jgi:hypothetical protein
MKPEQIPPPKTGEPGKKMPEGKAKEVHVIPPQPVAPPALEVTPVTNPKADSQF